MKSNLEQMKITVAKKTADTLRKEESLTGLSAGEIIDRLLLKTNISNTDVAALTICEYLIFVTNNQTEEKTIETILKVVSLLLMSHAENYNLSFEEATDLLKPFYKSYQCKLKKEDKNG